MPDRRTMEFVVRTPHQIVLETKVRSLRVLTETGHVGIRPRMQSMVLAVEAGLMNVVADNEDATSELFVGTAGGILLSDGHTVTLMTPLAVAGNDGIKIAEELDRAMHQPDSEMEARAAFSKLEGHILSEIRRGDTSESAGSPGELV